MKWSRCISSDRPSPFRDLFIGRPPPTFTLTACFEKLLIRYQKSFAEENANIHNDRYCCDGGEPLGLRRYSYDYFAHPTEQSTRSIPYKELDKIAAAVAKKNDRNENFPKATEIGEDGGRPLEEEEEVAAADVPDGEEGPEWGKYGAYSPTALRMQLESLDTALLFDRSVITGSGEGGKEGMRERGRSRDWALRATDW